MSNGMQPHPGQIGAASPWLPRFGRRSVALVPADGVDHVAPDHDGSPVEISHQPDRSEPAPGLAVRHWQEARGLRHGEYRRLAQQEPSVTG